MEHDPRHMGLPKYRVGGMTIAEARAARGLTCYAASQLMTYQRPYNLSKLEQNPEALPRVMVTTAIDLIAGYWPDVQLSDLLGEECRFVLLPRSRAALIALEREMGMR